MKSLNNYQFVEVKSLLYPGNNTLTLQLESQRTQHASASFVSAQIVMGRR